MSTFTLATSCLTTSNLPWFVDLPFQVPMPFCSLRHRALLLSPVTSTTGYCFCFGSIPSFFLDLFLHWSPVGYWAPTNLGSSSFSVLSFCLFILFMGFSRQEYWSGLPFPSPVTTFCQNSPLWPVCPGWPYRAWLSFIELDMAVVHVIRLVSFLWLWVQRVCPLMPSLSTYHLTGASLTLDVGNLFMAAPAKRSCCSLPWTSSNSFQLLATPAPCMDCFKTGKGVHQGGIFSSCLFNLYTEYIMQNTELDKSQPGRNISDLRYANATTLKAESEEELKSLLIRVK